MAAVVDASKCNACKSCEDQCPNGSIKVEGEVAIVNQDDCIDCAACESACPSGAIAMG